MRPLAAGVVAGAVAGLLAAAPRVRADEPAPGPPDPAAIAYQGTILQPGDVLNMHQGAATTGGAQTYGHTALYLGISPITGEPTFLDFSTWKDGMEHVAFHGRILAERDFLRYSARTHNSFDLFRHAAAGRIDRRRMWDEAVRIAKDQTYFFERGGSTWVEVCSSAAARALSAGLGENVLPGAFTAPDEVAESPAFTRVTGGRTIAFEVAIRDADARTGRAPDVPPAIDPADPRSDDPDVPVPPAYVSAVELKRRLNAAGDRVPADVRRDLDVQFERLALAFADLMDRRQTLAVEIRSQRAAAAAYQADLERYDAAPNPTDAAGEAYFAQWQARLTEEAGRINRWKEMLDLSLAAEVGISSNWERGPVARFLRETRAALGQ